MLSLLFFTLLAGVRSEWATDDRALRWGPYRPNLYFGVRPQAPQSLLTGLMWAAGDSVQNLNNTLRDTCEYNEVDGYGWTKYDARLGGSHTVLDGWLHFDMNTQFIKAEDGESWGIRIEGVPKSDAPADAKITVIFHVALEDMQEGSTKSLECKNVDNSTEHAIATCQGEDNTLGKFELKVFSNGKNKIAEGPAVLSLQVVEDKIWQAKNVWKETLAHRDELVLDAPNKGNLHFIQAVVQDSFSFDIVYSSSAAEKPFQPQDITSKLKDMDNTFPYRVDKSFPRDKAYADAKYATFTQSVLSQLLGGLGFFFGETKEDRSNATEYLETDLNFWEKSAEARRRAPITTTKPFTLLSHTPSRPTFARGFLWDEGFHLQAVMEWDLDLAISVIKTWMGLMDADGWIGREQILGPEARNTVPPDFQVQYPQFANPPTILLLLTNLLSKLTKESPYAGHTSQYLSSGSQDAGKELLEELYPLFARHAAWFRRTQVGNFSDVYPRPEGTQGQEGYRWRGATPGTCLTSGLDDYPRANPPHPGELHVDALSWVAASAATLQKVAKYIGKDTEAKTHGDNLDAALKNLDVLHWKGDQSNAYCDTTIGEGNKYEHICHHGYVSLMPLLLGLLKPDHPHLSAVLDLVSDKEHLFSDFGLRSLSAKNNNYGTGVNYWRGAIWMNFNVLAVQQLWSLGQQEGPEKERAKSIALDLRDRVVKTVFNSWEKTGYIWEQYSDKTGEGSHSHPFTGWTACVILLMGLRDVNGTI